MLPLKPFSKKIHGPKYSVWPRHFERSSWVEVSLRSTSTTGIMPRRSSNNLKIINWNSDTSARLPAVSNTVFDSASAVPILAVLYETRTVRVNNVRANLVFNGLHEHNYPPPSVRRVKNGWELYLFFEVDRILIIVPTCCCRMSWGLILWGQYRWRSFMDRVPLPFTWSGV